MRQRVASKTKARLNDNGALDLRETCYPTGLVEEVTDPAAGRHGAGVAGNPERNRCQSSGRIMEW